MYLPEGHGAAASSAKESPAPSPAKPEGRLSGEKRSHDEIGAGSNNGAGGSGSAAAAAVAPATAIQRLHSKRCPAWCDRILFDEAARQLIERSSIPPSYDSELQADPYVDHNKVVLAFTCR